MSRFTRCFCKSRRTTDTRSRFMAPCIVTHEDFDHIEPRLNPTLKPHGRIAYSLHVTNSGMYGGYLDVSVMPKTERK